jgi:hypothetical protein
VLLWISVVGCNPVAQNYLDAASLIPAQHLALVREIEITHEDHASVSTTTGRVSLPPQKNDKRLYHLSHEFEHLVFHANGQDLQFHWATWFWWSNVPRGQLSGSTARVLAAGDWWQAAQEDAADSYAALFTGDPLDPDRRAWLCEQVDGLARLAGCGAATVSEAQVEPRVHAQRGCR